jgi:PhzF family phenazine biosynthesis protein
MNLSETAFLVPAASHYELRWLTPKVEVDLCGHATLASAAVLWHAGKVPSDRKIEFSTRSGLLSASRRGELIELNFPLTEVTPQPPPTGLLESLGVAAKFTGKTRFDYLVEVDSDATLRAMQPDFVRLASVESRGVIVTARSSETRFDFLSRFFAPAAGLNEDPVTGSAHCALAHYWRPRLDKTEFHAYQASERGGVLSVRITGDRVLLGGEAVLISEGRLLVPPTP